MSRNNRKSQKLDLKLNLSLPTRGDTSRRMSVDDDSSSPSSCLSSDENEQARGLNSPEATSMVLAGCPRCLMYVMLSEDEPKCPKCKSSVLLDFNTSSNKKTRKT